MQTVHLELESLNPEEQVASLRQHCRLLRGKGAIMRAAVKQLPVRQYISLLERGYRVTLERTGAGYMLVLRPDGSMPRSGARGAHSIASDRDGRVYTTTRENRVAIIDAGSRRVIKHIPTGDDP